MSIIVSSGAVSSGCIVQNDTMQVYGSALETTLKYGGSMTIFENGEGSDTAVNSGGRLYLSGGEANGTIVNRSG